MVVSFVTRAFAKSTFEQRNLPYGIFVTVAQISGQILREFSITLFVGGRWKFVLSSKEIFNL
jgi:hypothetical protein